MSYRVEILRRAQRELEHVPVDRYSSVRDAIRALGLEPRPAGTQKLTGRDGWRIRVGDYRVIYKIDDAQALVTILHIGHRRYVYR